MCTPALSCMGFRSRSASRYAMRMFPEEEYVREEKRNSMREASGGKTISPPFHENPSQGSVCMFLSSIRKSVRNILSGFTSGCGLSVRMVMNPPWPPAYNSFYVLYTTRCYGRQIREHACLVCCKYAGYASLGYTG